MASIATILPGNSYKQLLQIGSANVGLAAALAAVSDAGGQASPLYLSLTKGKWQTGTDSTDNFQFLDQAGTGIILNIDSTNARVGIGTAAPVSLTELQGGLTTVGSILTLGTKETSVVANDVLGRVNFYAPLDAAGGDANLVAGSIVAIAESTFSAINNSTSLHFQTGASETATTKLQITGAGYLTTPLGGRLYMDGLGATNNSYLYMQADDNWRFVSGGATALDIQYDYVKMPALSKLYLDGGGDTYIAEVSANRLDLVVGGAALSFYGSYIQGVANTIEIDLTAVSATNPSYAFYGDSDTGIGHAAANQGSLIAGANEVCRFAYVSAGNQPALYFPEITTPTAIADMGSIYFKADNKMYCQTGDGVEHEIAFV